MGHCRSFSLSFLLSNRPLLNGALQVIQFVISSNGYLWDYVCHSGSLPNDGVTDSFSLALSIFLSMARLLVSSFFTNAFVRDHVWHPYVIAGKRHWLKTFVFRLVGRCLSRKISLYFSKTLHLACILIFTYCFVLFSIAIVCPR